jgi:hypothetical protein
MLIVSFGVECRLEEQCAQIPPGIYLPLKRVECSLFLVPGLGCCLALDAPLSGLGCIELGQGACPEILFRDMAPLA